MNAASLPARCRPRMMRRSKKCAETASGSSAAASPPFDVKATLRRQRTASATSCRSGACGTLDRFQCRFARAGRPRHYKALRRRLPVNAFGCGASGDEYWAAGTELSASARVEMQLFHPGPTCRALLTKVLQITSPHEARPTARCSAGGFARLDLPRYGRLRSRPALLPRKAYCGRRAIPAGRYDYRRNTLTASRALVVFIAPRVRHIAPFRRSGVDAIRLVVFTRVATNSPEQPADRSDRRGRSPRCSTATPASSIKRRGP